MYSTCAIDCICCAPTMAATASGWLLRNFCSSYKHVAGYNLYPGIFLQIREYAARKGIRERAAREKAKKKKVKTVVQKVGYIPFKERNVAISPKIVKKLDIYENEIKKPRPIDNVWIVRFHHWKIYPFDEAVACHREMHHPTMYNLPNSKISALIELNMKGEKKNKMIDGFTRVVDLPHKFHHGEERKILAFAKASEIRQTAMEAGATLCGGHELIKKIQSGEVSLKDFDYHVAHTDILSELLLIRGLMRKRFPNTKQGTLGDNIDQLVRKYTEGIKYSVQSHELRSDYGIFEVDIGTLNMETQQLEENFVTILEDINSVRPNREGPFITRIRLISPPSKESFKLDLEHYLPCEVRPEIEDAEDQDNMDAVIASN